MRNPLCSMTRIFTIDFKIERLKNTPILSI
nr:MAG TPA: hypothetical protein [Caudoviricetes sp.]